MTPIRLIILPATPEQPCRQILFGPDDQVIEDSRLDYGGPWLDGAPVVLAAPGSDIAFRRLALPNGSRAQATAAAQLAMEAEAASGAETLSVAIGAPDHDGLSPVCAVAANRLRAWIEVARALGAEPDVVIPDYLLVSDGGEAVHTLDFGDRTGVRGQGLALSGERSLMPFLLEGRMVMSLSWGPQRFAELAAACRRPLLNLKPREARPQADRRLVTLAAGLAVAVLVSPLLVDMASAWRADRAADRDRARAVALARSALGSGTAIDDPAGQIRARRLAVSSGGDFGASAAGLFAAVESVEGARLESLLYDPSGTLRATISYADYSSVESLVSAASANGLVLEEVSALDQAGVRLGDFIARPA